ncbi:MAG: hypothetical protein IJW95_03575 [Clostridia bacterium]|nr:hypothetical protein [Clostridia bacterium]
MNHYQNHDFFYYLRRGHGRAYLMLRYETDDEKRREYRDAVIYACLHDQRLDPQIFFERDLYLWDMISLFPDRDDIVADILRRAAIDLPQELPYWDFQHRTDVLQQLKTQGYADAEAVLNRYYDTLLDFLRSRTDVPPCLDEDMQKMTSLASRLGNPMPDLGQDPLPTLEEWKAKHKAMPHPAPPETVEELIGALQEGFSLPRCRKNLQSLTEKEIRQVADAALAEEDFVARAQLFSAFAVVDYPYDPAPLIEVARENLAGADGFEEDFKAYQRFLQPHRALARIRHPAVREYAEWLLATFPAETRWNTGLEILVRNYIPADRDRILTWRKNSITSEMEGNTVWGTVWHAIDSSIVEAAKADPHRFDPDFFPMIYYTTLCSNERCDAFRIMESLGMLTPVMLEEGVHDSEDRLQKHAKELLHYKT